MFKVMNSLDSTCLCVNQTKLVQMIYIVDSIEGCQILCCYHAEATGCFYGGSYKNCLPLDLGGEITSTVASSGCTS